MKRGLYGSWHLAFLLAVGAVSWALLGYETASAGSILGDPPAEVGHFLLFLVFGLCARALAFRLFHTTTLSLDSAYYIAAFLILGPLPAAWLTSLCLIADTVVRTAHREFIRHTDTRPWRFNFGYLFMNSGAVAAQLLLVEFIYPVGELRASLQTGVDPIPWWALETAPALTGIFVALHYSVTAAFAWVQGFSRRMIVRRILGFGIAAEAATIPLSLVMVLVYHPDEPLLLWILGSTFLLFNFIFQRLTKTSDVLRARVEELSALNRVGQACTATPQLSELLSYVAEATLSALRKASVFAVGLWDAKESLVRHHVFDRETGRVEERVVPKGEGLSAWVLENRRPLRIFDLERQTAVGDSTAAYNILPEDRGKGIRSWLGVPLIARDEAIGVFSVQSGEAGAFGEEQERLLVSMAGQAAVAIVNARLYELATVDGLTQIYVRRYFDQRLLEEWQRSVRLKQPFAVVLLDLDDFKLLNDRYGHQAGDRALRDVARAIKAGLRGMDIAARYGGEEFAVLLPQTNVTEAQRVAERVKAEIRALYVNVGDNTVHVTASVGVAAYPECGEGDAFEVLGRADVALYAAKEAGKDRVVTFRPPPFPRIQAV